MGTAQKKPQKIAACGANIAFCLRHLTHASLLLKLGKKMKIIHNNFFHNDKWHDKEEA